MSYTFSQARFDAQKPNEEFIQNFLIQSGCLVIPFTDQCLNGAPMALSADYNKVLPDFQVFDYQQKRNIFVEVKTAETFPLNRKHNTRVLGIKKHQWRAYKDIHAKTSIDILFIWFVENRLVLTSQISRMSEPFPCQCRSCAIGVECDQDNLLYFPQSNFSINCKLTRLRYFAKY